MHLYVVFLTLVGPPIVPDENTAARALLDRAIVAHGGLERLSAQPARTWKGKGTFHTTHGNIPFVVDGARQGIDQMFMSLESTDPESHYSRKVVLSGEKGWVRLNGRLNELGGDAMEEERKRGYSNWLTSLYPLRDADFELSRLPDIVVEDRAAVGLLVRHAGRREVRMYFDAETYLLVKREAVVHDVEHGGKGVIEEVLFGGYVNLRGVRHSTKIKVYWDGKLRYEVELTEQTRKAKLDDAVFGRP
jgi:hypothetical protein